MPPPVAAHISATAVNKVVAELLTAGGSTFANPPANYFRGPYDNGAPVVRGAQELAESTAQLFFAIRLQCAKCHNHPFERWTQDDYYHMVAWFSRLQAKPDAANPGSPPKPYPAVAGERARDLLAGSGEAKHPQSGSLAAPGVPGLPAPAIAGDGPCAARAGHLAGKPLVRPGRNPSPLVPPARAGHRRPTSGTRSLGQRSGGPRPRVRRQPTSMSSTSFARSQLQDVSARFPPKPAIEDESTFHRHWSGGEADSGTAAFDVARDGSAGAFTECRRDMTITASDEQVIYTGGQYASWDRHRFRRGVRSAGAALRVRRESDSTWPVPGEKTATFLGSSARQPARPAYSRRSPDVDIVDQLFLATLSRPPLAEETRAASRAASDAATSRAWEDINGRRAHYNEFCFGTE